MLNVKTDSRKIKPSDTFVAVKCAVNDGHAYIKSAIEKGATSIVVNDSYNLDKEVLENKNIKITKVKDTRIYLENYLKEHYSKLMEEMRIIGITGTNGKTTSAYLIYTLLNSLGIKCAYIGTIGYYLNEKVSSLPNTSPDICDLYDLIINAKDNGFKTVVLEASSEGLINNRLEGIPFDYTIFTNLTQDHLNVHKTMDNYRKAKQLLFEKLKPNGKRVVNIDDSYSKYFIGKNTITFGKKESNYQIIDYKVENQNTIINLKINNNDVTIESPLLGEHNIYNLLVALIIALDLNINLSDIKEKIKTISCPPGRMDTIKWNGNNIIIDYAHTPDALERIINSVKPITIGKVYTVFGCTGDRDRTKRPIMMNIASTLSDKVIITNDDPHNEDPESILKDILENNKNTNYEVELDRKKAIEKGINLLTTNDTLLILGKGHEEVMIIKNERIPFNDKEVVSDILKTKN